MAFSLRPSRSRWSRRRAPVTELLQIDRPTLLKMYKTALRGDAGIELRTIRIVPLNTRDWGRSQWCISGSIATVIPSADDMTVWQRLFLFSTGFSFCRRIRAGERSIVLD